MATKFAPKPAKPTNGRAAPTVTVRFGDVTVTGPKPSAEAVKANVERSSRALERGLNALLKPGFTLRPKKDVPLYHADENEPGIYVRRLNGRTERGRLVDGSFRVID